MIALPHVFLVILTSALFFPARDSGRALSATSPQQPGTQEQPCEEPCEGCQGSVFPFDGVRTIEMDGCTITFTFKMKNGQCCGEPCAAQKACELKVSTAHAGNDCCPVVGFVVGGTLDVFWWPLDSEFTTNLPCWGPPLALIPGGGLGGNCETLGFGEPVYVQCSPCPDWLP